MNKLLIGCVALALIIAGIVTYLFLRPTPDPVPQPTVTFPTATSSTSTGSANGQIRSFLDDPRTVEDPDNAGYYAIGYHTFGEGAVENPPYLILYIEETKYFTITLTDEPIGETRRNAEVYLMNVLGFTKEQMCLLNYTVVAPTWVNTQYAGMNLGFSFCPGSIKLPQ